VNLRLILLMSENILFILLHGRVIIYTAYLDDEKKQVLQLFGQRSSDILRCHNNVLCDLPNDLENPALLVTGNNIHPRVLLTCVMLI